MSKPCCCWTTGKQHTYSVPQPSWCSLKGHICQQGAYQQLYGGRGHDDLQGAAHAEHLEVVTGLAGLRSTRLCHNRIYPSLIGKADCVADRCSVCCRRLPELALDLPLPLLVPGGHHM